VEVVEPEPAVVEAAPVVVGAVVEPEPVAASPVIVQSLPDGRGSDLSRAREQAVVEPEPVVAVAEPPAPVAVVDHEPAVVVLEQVSAVQTVQAAQEAENEAIQTNL